MLSRISRSTIAAPSIMPRAVAGFQIETTRQTMPARQRGAEARRMASFLPINPFSPHLVDEEGLQRLPPMERALYQPVMVEAEIVREAPAEPPQQAPTEAPPVPETATVFSGLFARAL